MPIKVALFNIILIGIVDIVWKIRIID